MTLIYPLPQIIRRSVGGTLNAVKVSVDKQSLSFTNASTGKKNVLTMTNLVYNTPMMFVPPSSVTMSELRIGGWNLAKRAAEAVCGVYRCRSNVRICWCGAAPTLGAQSSVAVSDVKAEGWRFERCAAEAVYI